jgi:hypothetical protein
MAGPAAQISSDDPAFGRLSEDPAGRLMAAWSARRDPGAGVPLRSGFGASGLAPAQRLIDGAGNGQIALGAAADGGGFALFNHTGGVSSPGQIVAVGFGTRAATGRPGLGGADRAASRCRRQARSMPTCASRWVSSCRQPRKPRAPIRAVSAARIPPGEPPSLGSGHRGPEMPRRKTTALSTSGVVTRPESRDPFVSDVVKGRRASSWDCLEERWRQVQYAARAEDEITTRVELGYLAQEATLLAASPSSVIARVFRAVRELVSQSG